MQDISTGNAGGKQGWLGNGSLIQFAAWVFLGDVPQIKSEDIGCFDKTALYGRIDGGQLFEHTGAL